MKWICVLLLCVTSCKIGVDISTDVVVSSVFQVENATYTLGQSGLHNNKIFFFIDSTSIAKLYFYDQKGTLSSVISFKKGKGPEDFLPGSFFAKIIDDKVVIFFLNSMVFKIYDLKGVYIDSIIINTNFDCFPEFPDFTLVGSDIIIHNIGNYYFAVYGSDGELKYKKDREDKVPPGAVLPHGRFYEGGIITKYNDGVMVGLYNAPINISYYNRELKKQWEIVDSSENSQRVEIYNQSGAQLITGKPEISGMFYDNDRILLYEGLNLTLKTKDEGFETKILSSPRQISEYSIDKMKKTRVINFEHIISKNIEKVVVWGVSDKIIYVAVGAEDVKKHLPEYKNLVKTDKMVFFLLEYN